MIDKRSSKGVLIDNTITQLVNTIWEWCCWDTNVIPSYLYRQYKLGLVQEARPNWEMICVRETSEAYLSVIGPYDPQTTDCPNPRSYRIWKKGALHK